MVTALVGEVSRRTTIELLGTARSGSGPTIKIGQGRIWVSFTRALPAGVAYTDRLISVLGFRYETWRWDNSYRSRFSTQPVGPGPGVSSNPSVGPNPTAAGVVERVDMQLRLWTPFVAFSIYPVLALVAWPLRSVHRRTRNQCSNCSYMLVGNESGVCPECGRARVAWIVPRWQRIVIALLCATIACWLLEFMNHQLALEHRCAIWLLTTFRVDHGMWWVTSICRTLVIGLVSIGVYIYVSPERFGEDDLGFHEDDPPAGCEAERAQG